MTPRAARADSDVPLSGRRPDPRLERNLTNMKRRLVLGSLAGVLAGALVMAPVASAQEARAELNGGSTVLTLDRGAVQTLAAAEIDVSTAGPASGPTRGGALGFPVTGGTIESPGEVESSPGNIIHSGELALTRGDQQIVLSEFDIDLAGAVLTALVDGERIPFLTGTPGRYLSDRETIFQYLDFETRLTPEAADALNDTFDTTTFEEGFLFAIADTTATTFQ